MAPLYLPLIGRGCRSTRDSVGVTQAQGSGMLDETVCTGVVDRDILRGQGNPLTIAINKVGKTQFNRISSSVNTGPFHLSPC